MSMYVVCVERTKFIDRIRELLVTLFEFILWLCGSLLWRSKWNQRIDNGWLPIKNGWLNQRDSSIETIDFSTIFFLLFCRCWKHCKRHKTFISLCVSLCVCVYSVAAYRSTECHSTEYTYGISVRWLRTHTHTHNTPYFLLYNFTKVGRKEKRWRDGGKKGY